MDEKKFYEMIDEREGYASLSFPALMRKVYVWMTLALVITAITAYGVGTSPGLVALVYSSKFTFFGLMLVQLAVVIGLSSAINRMSLATATLMFVLYSVLTGVTFSGIVSIYDPMLVTKVFFITAGTFGIMSLIGYTTKADLTSLGRLLLMGLLGIILATVVNIFMRSSMLDVVCSYIGVAVFIGLTAYDTQKIRQMMAVCPDAGEEAQKLALLGSLSLYLDFINIFLYLLRIFGRDE